MNERAELEQAIQQLEAQRDILGNAAVDAALAGINQRLAELDEFERRDAAAPRLGEHIGERRVVTVLFCDVAGSTALAEGMDHLEIGRCSGDRKHLQQAESILEEIGSVFDLADSRKALSNLTGN
jgi:class 3 adenylate cyclase